MRLIFDCLVLEITRRCNMSCAHCLRGPAQNLDMDPKIIDRVTTQVDHIHSITFSGGEPSLNGAAIEHFRWASFFFNCSFEYFWLTTNARMFKENFYTALWELYSIAGDPEACVLTISGDQYHGIRSNHAMMKYQDLPFFSYEKMDDIPDGALLDEGMASINQLGAYRQVNLQKELQNAEWDNEGDTLYVGDTIYINAKGDVLLGCDLSYKSQKKHAVGNVLAEPLADILRRQLPQRLQSA